MSWLLAPQFFFSSINCLWNSSCLVFNNISSYILCCCIISSASILSFVALSCTFIFILATLFCDSRVAFVASATTYILKVSNFCICSIIDCSLLPHNATNLDNAFAIDWLSWSTSGCFRFSDVLWQITLAFTLWLGNGLIGNTYHNMSRWLTCIHTTWIPTCFWSNN